MLLTGGSGWNGDRSKTADSYDPLTGIFTPMADMTLGREQHTARLLNDGRVLLSGGFNSVFWPDGSVTNVNLNSAELITPVTLRQRLPRKLPPRRLLHFTHRPRHFLLLSRLD